MIVYVEKPITTIKEADFNVLVQIRSGKNKISQIVTNTGISEGMVKFYIRNFRKLGYITPLGIYLSEAGQIMISAYLTQRSLAERKHNQMKDVDKFLTNGTQ